MTDQLHRVLRRHLAQAPDAPGQILTRTLRVRYIFRVLGC